MATIVGPDGRAVETVRARWVGGAHFIAHFQRHLADGDEAWVRAALDSQQADGRTVADATEAAVTARPSSGALWAERIRVGLLLVLAGAITAITAYAVWLLRRPALDARVDLGPFGGPSGLRIDRGRWRRVDGHGLISVWLWAGRDGAIHRSQAVIPWPFRTDEVPTTRRSTPARTSGRPAPTGRYAPRQS